MGMACSTHRSGVHIRFWWDIQQEEAQLEDLDVGGSIILRGMLDK
jgi:hypothetical protein